MERRGFLKQSLSAVALGLAGGCTQGERSVGSAGAVDQAQLHRDAIVIDTYGKLYLEDFQKGHVDAIVHGIGVEEIFRCDAREGIIDPPEVGKNICDNLFEGPDVVKRVLQRVDEILQQSVRRHPDSVELALRSSDVKRIAGAGKIAVIPMLNAGWIDNDLAVLRMYHRMGIRVFALTHIAAFDWVDSSGELNPKPGLSDFGREVVRECNRIGMMVDISHASDQAFWDTIRTSSRPIIATHSGCRALCYVQRNLTDEMLRALADNGGVVRIFTVPSYLDTKALNDMMKIPVPPRLHGPGSAPGPAVLRSLGDCRRHEEYAGFAFLHRGNRSASHRRFPGPHRPCRPSGRNRPCGGLLRQRARRGPGRPIPVAEPDPGSGEAGIRRPGHPKDPGRELPPGLGPGGRDLISASHLNLFRLAYVGDADEASRSQAG